MLALPAQTEVSSAQTWQRPWRKLRGGCRIVLGKDVKVQLIIRRVSGTDPAFCVHRGGRRRQRRPAMMLTVVIGEKTKGTVRDGRYIGTMIDRPKLGGGGKRP